MEKIFKEFNPVSALEWKNQIIKDLKGESFDSLIWANDNGFDVQPFYTTEDLKQNYDPAFTHHDWEICVNTHQKTEKEINSHLLTNLNRGASSFLMKLANLNLKEALQAVELNYIHSSFEVNENNVGHLHNYLADRYDLNEINSPIFFENFDELKNLNTWHQSISPFLGLKTIKTVGFNALPYHNLNATVYYEVAIIFSAIIEQLEFLSSKGKSFTSDIVVKTGVSSDFFTQIAKLRAIRRLWNCFKSEYRLNNNLYLIVETSLSNKSIGDKHNNLLRSSLEAMAAVAGGCNELLINDFDVFNATKDAAAERLSINQQLILKHESYLDTMADIACGSYYIETFTDNIASKALETFKYFESEGGYLKCIEKNIFKSTIAKQAALKQEEINSNKQVVIGVNKFKNDKESIELSDLQMKEIEGNGIQNPVLNYELQNKKSHA